MSSPFAAPRTELLDLVSAVHRDRDSGIVEIQVEGALRRLHFSAGELHLPSDHPLAAAVAQQLARGADGAGRTALRKLMERIARHLASWPAADAAFVPEDLPAGALVGPLPTALLLMEWAATREPVRLLEELGGEDGLLVAVAPGNEPTARALRLLEPGAAVLLARLARPTAVSELIRRADTGREQVLGDLARLRAAGLVQAAEGEGPQPAPAAELTVAPDVLRRYAERMARDLAARPLSLDPAAHRARLSDLLARAPDLNAYELLGVGFGASDEEIHLGFQRLARVVHPSHGVRLRLSAGERELWALFERATDAYLILSQPERRRRYNESVKGVPARRGGAERPEEARLLARNYFQRATSLIAAGEYHFAVELLKQAVQAHPLPEYHALLGKVQARNPQWLRHARDSYRRALLLGADDPGLRVALARVHEDLEELEEARRLYQEALSRDPADAEARAGLERLTPDEPPRRFGLFGRGR
jgi:curved DNA-binding protein CbpA